jgi:hypothetical protein
MKYKKTENDRMFFKANSGCYLISGCVLMCASLAGLYFMHQRGELLQKNSLFIVLALIIGYAMFSWKSAVIIDKTQGKVYKSTKLFGIGKEREYNISDISEIQIIRELRAPNDQDIRSQSSSYHVYTAVLGGINVDVAEYSKKKKTVDIAEKIKSFLNIDINDRTE